MMRILVTGANGQLGSCIRKFSNKYPNWNFNFLGSSELNISNSISVKNVLLDNYDYCINCAAYTNVDLAETNKEDAFLVNSHGPELLAKKCFEHKTTLIHISTDFVFDGAKEEPYIEEDITNPLNIYGESKLLGEQNIVSSASKYLIIRTSWLYSEFGSNFVKTMISLSKSESKLSVVDDQRGSPTNANDLALAILDMINYPIKNYGVYHYSNLGEASWYEFSEMIFSIMGSNLKLERSKTIDTDRPAQRPRYSVMDKSKIQKHFRLEIPEWRDSLKSFLIEHQIR